MSRVLTWVSNSSRILHELPSEVNHFVSTYIHLNYLYRSHKPRAEEIPELQNIWWITKPIIQMLWLHAEFVQELQKFIDTDKKQQITWSQEFQNCSENLIIQGTHSLNTKCWYFKDRKSKEKGHRSKLIQFHICILKWRGKIFWHTNTSNHYPCYQTVHNIHLQGPCMQLCNLKQMLDFIA